MKYPPMKLVHLTPADDIQSAVQGALPGTTFLLSAGTWRLADSDQIVPHDGDIFAGAGTGLTILSGARVIHPADIELSPDFPGLWRVQNQTQEGMVHGECDNDNPRCDRPEDIFFDGVPLLHVNSTDLVDKGSWFFDYDHDTIYFADDPSTATLIETSVSQQLFNGAAGSVTVANLTATMFANPAQFGAIGGQSPGEAWVVSSCTATLNHGTGIKVGNGGSIITSTAHRNGQMGVSAGGIAPLIDGNQLSENNWAGFSVEWEAGGSKFAATTDAVIRNNVVFGNVGPGLWTDISNVGALIEGNLVFNNSNDGIKHEISYRARIVSNTCCGNGWGKDGWLWGSDILVQNSRDVEVHGNTVVLFGVVSGGNGVGLIQQDRGADPEFGPHITVNTSVLNNTVVFFGDSDSESSAGGQRNGGQHVGGVCDDVNASVFFDPDAGQNHFDLNRYIVVDDSRGVGQPEGGQSWMWNGETLNFDDWQKGAGMDLSGSLETTISSALPPLPVECLPTKTKATTKVGTTSSPLPVTDWFSTAGHGV